MKKIYKLIFSSVSLSSVIIPVAITTTSCSEQTYFQKSRVDAIEPRLFVDKNSKDPDFIFPWYAIPDDLRDVSSPELGNHPKRIYPPYLKLWAVLFPNDKLNADKLDDNGVWPKVNQATNTITYEQFFLSAKVCEQGLGIDPKKPFVNIKQLIKDSKIIPHDDQGQITGTFNLDLSYCYKDLPYADEAIKVWLNPIFIQNLKNEALTSFWDYIVKLDLSNNDLWYLPLLGYDDSKQTQADKWDRFTQNAEPYNKKMFNNLNEIDLRLNHLTCLSNKTSEEENKRDDWSRFVHDVGNKKGVIHLDGNYFGYDLKNTSFLASLNVKYANVSALDLTTYNYNAHTTAIRQSIGFYSDFDLLDYVTKQNVSQALYNEFNEEKLKAIDLDAKPDKSLIADQTSFLYTAVSKLDKNAHNDWANAISYTAIEILNKNYLASSYIHSESIGENPLVVSLIEGQYYLFDFVQVEYEKWNIVHSIEIPFPQTYALANKNGEEVIVAQHYEGQKWMIIFSISYPFASKTLIVLFTIVFTLTGLFISWAWFYYSYLRRKLASRRKQADIVCLLDNKEKE